jgi:hypothetical protein
VVKVWQEDVSHGERDVETLLRTAPQMKFAFGSITQATPLGWESEVEKEKCRRSLFVAVWREIAKTTSLISNKDVEEVIPILADMIMRLSHCA